jgi:hypothetical protein
VLLAGLDGSGKTKFLLADVIKSLENIEPTYGFNYQEKMLGETMRVGIWDIGGRDSLRCLWPSFYRNIPFSAVIFLVNPWQEDRLSEARRELQILTNEEELREAAFCVLINNRGSKEPVNKTDIMVRLGLRSLHNSIRHACYLLDVTNIDDEYTNAMTWLSSQINRKD